jgi:hypothetical protein
MQQLKPQEQIEQDAIKSLDKITSQVRYLLLKFPAARSNDRILILKYLQYFSKQLVYNAETKKIELREPMTYEQFMRLPSFESITRLRRMLQAKAKEAIEHGHGTQEDAEMLASSKVARQRAILDDTFTRYFLRD